MKRFIEVTEKYSGSKILTAIDRIMNVILNDDGIVFIETGLDSRGKSTGIVVSETYGEIKQKLRESEV